MKDTTDKLLMKIILYMKGDPSCGPIFSLYIF